MHLGRNDTSESRSSLHNLEKDVHVEVRRGRWGVRGAGQCKEYQVEWLSHKNQWSGRQKQQEDQMKRTGEKRLRCL